MKCSCRSSDRGRGCGIWKPATYVSCATIWWACRIIQAKSTNWQTKNERLCWDLDSTISHNPRRLRHWKPRLTNTFKCSIIHVHRVRASSMRNVPKWYYSWKSLWSPIHDFPRKLPFDPNSYHNHPLLITITLTLLSASHHHQHLSTIVIFNK